MALSTEIHSVNPSTGTAAELSVDRDSVLQELHAICSHRQFSQSKKNTEFLRHVVFEALAGRSEELKERTLGIRLYQRSPSYDTGSDSVVRVRANDLRKRLSCYYEENKATAGWRIHLPLHSYVPLFLPEPENKAFPSLDHLPGPASAVVAPSLSLWQLMQPTLIFLFLCAATFRWEVFSAAPYLDFWTTLLKGHSQVTFVLDGTSAGPGYVNVDQINLSEPLQKTAIALHVSSHIETSSNADSDHSDAVFVHITDNLPDIAAARIDPNAAYITIIPGKRPSLWIQSETMNGLRLGIHSISSEDSFPYTLESALRASGQSQLRISKKANGQLLIVADDHIWQHRT